MEDAIQLGSGDTCSAGDAVEAQWREEWHGALVRGPGQAAGRIRITWDFDGSQQDIVAENVRLPGGASKNSGSQPATQGALKGARVIAVIGNEKNRRACVLQIMASSESACPGVWMASLEEAEQEAREGKSEDEVFCGVEAAKHEGTAAELEWLRSATIGQQALRSAARAAGCIIQIVGQAYFFAGFPAQRSRAREYVQWASKSRMQMGIAGLQGQALARRGLSVVDADMRDDVTTMTVHEAHMAWLRPNDLNVLEQETETLLVFDDGGGSVLERGSRRLLICGEQDQLRQKARARVEALCASAPAPSAAAAAAPAAGISLVGASMAAKRPAEDPSAGAFDAKRPRSGVPKSDPKAVLKTIPWPDSINQWGLLQNKIWAGHPKLQRGWIRCWSRSQDSEYYLRLTDKLTTFQINDVLA